MRKLRDDSAVLESSEKNGSKGWRTIQAFCDDGGGVTGSAESGVSTGGGDLSDRVLVQPIIDQSASFVIPW